MKDGKPVLLYLDNDWRDWLVGEELEKVQLLVIPEVFEHRFSLMLEDAPSGIQILQDKALNPRGDYMSVYQPTYDLLRKIQQISESGEIEYVVIGNNNDEGVAKAQVIAEGLRARTIISANAWPPEKLYRPFGYTRFTQRIFLARELRKMLEESSV